MEERVTIYTEAEYLDIEKNSETKNEFFNGQMYAMAGATKNHVLIVSNLIMSLGIQLKKKKCTVFGTDMRLKISETGMYTYPDISIACEDQKFIGDKSNTLLNPVIVIEVLSDSTERYDRGEKFAHYRQLNSLREYVLVSQNSKKIEKYFRNANGKWELSETTAQVTELDLTSIDCVLYLEEVYDKVDVGSVERRA